jgi:hypothetical protein
VANYGHSLQLVTTSTMRTEIRFIKKAIILCACQLFVFYYYFTLRRNIVAEAMIGSETMLVFVGVATALAAVPGPDNIFVLTQSAVHGRIAELIVTLGIALGLFVHTTAVALGVAVIFQTSQ